MKEQGFRLKVTIALRNLRGHRVRSLALGGTVFVATFVTVLGMTILSNIERAMRDSIVSSITGDIQVWSAEAPDDLEMVNFSSVEADVGEIESFETLESQLMAIDGVEEVIPMALGTAVTSGTSEMDRVVKDFADATYSGSPDRLHAARDRVLQLARRLAARGDSASEGTTARRRSEVLQRVMSDPFVNRMENDPDSALPFLQTEFATLVPPAQPIYLHYLATDPAGFARAFDRFQIVKGEEIPPDHRGLLMSDRTFEQTVKHPVAVELDLLGRTLKRSGTLEEPTVRSQIERLVARAGTLAVEIDAEEEEPLVVRLRDALDADQNTGLVPLLEKLLTVTDDNFQARKELFYEAVAPLIRLYALSPGETVVLQSFTKNGYFRSVRVRFYGTYEFRGLESSSIAGSKELLDLVTFRELYGKMSEEQRRELDDIRASVGVEAVSRDSAEDALFGGGASLGTTDDAIDTADEDSAPEPNSEASEDEIELPAVTPAEDLEPRPLAPGELRSGLVKNVAVMLADGTDVEDVLPSIDALESVRATDWRRASGIVGQFTFVMSTILYIAVLILLVIAAFVINNTALISTIQRTSEFGTLRAIGAQKDTVLSMVLLETLILAIASALAGSLVAVAIIAWLGNVGITAPTGIVVFLFGGEVLYPTIEAWPIVLATLLVSIVTTMATLFPARFAMRVPPVVAMRE